MTTTLQIQESIEGGLKTLAAQSLDALDADIAEIVAERIGDAIRIGVDVPTELREWLRHRTGPDLTALCEGTRTRVVGEIVPADVEDVSQLENAVGTRDRAESTQVAVLGACMARSCAPVEAVEGWVQFRDALAAFDRSLSSVADRDAVERALGERRALLGDHPWTRCCKFAAADGSENPDETVGQLPEGALARPPDHVLAAYVETGRYSRWVEGIAERMVEVAEDLAELIETFLEMGEPVGFVPRLWKRRRGQSADATSSGVVELPLRFAMAAASDTTEDVRVVRLGRLAPLSAEATLTADATELELRVLAGDEPLTSVTLGDRSVTSVDPSGSWVVRVPIQEAPVEIGVEAEGGLRFAGTVRAVLPRG